MISEVVAALQEAAAHARRAAPGYAFATGQAGGIAAALGLFGIKGLSLCDDISDAYETGDADFMAAILSETAERLENPASGARIDDGAAIGWPEYGAALQQAAAAQAAGDNLRYALMSGFTAGLMFNNPGPDYPEYGTIRDAVLQAYQTESAETLHWAQARIGAGLRMSDPTPFMGKEHYDRHYEERLRMMRWIQNFGLRQARAGEQGVAVPGSMTVNRAVRQQNDRPQNDRQNDAADPPHPIENCYWVIPGQLLAGEYPRNLDEASSPAKLARLTDAGVTAFIDLTEASELKPYDYLLDGPSHQRFPIRDVSIPASPELTKSALDAIDRHLAEGRMVYVHCWGGVGRTGTIIGCWLARHRAPGAAALELLQDLWQTNPKSRCRQSPETEAQRQYVRDWQE